jgi:hypothetical protein
MFLILRVVPIPHSEPYPEADQLSPRYNLVNTYKESEREHTNMTNLLRLLKTQLPIKIFRFFFFNFNAALNVQQTREYMKN